MEGLVAYYGQWPIEVLCFVMFMVVAIIYVLLGVFFGSIAERKNQPGGEYYYARPRRK